MKLVFASNNINIEILSLEDIDCFNEIPETATTIEGNAILKANYVTQHYGYNCFADDSGLEIEALNGAPGVFSARYAGEPKDDEKNIQKVLENLKNTANKKANFKTVICLNLNNTQHLFTGVVNGKIIEKPKGKNGFGYDPIFIPEGYLQTFAELSINEKSKISHRAIAISKMIQYLKNFQ